MITNFRERGMEIMSNEALKLLKGSSVLNVHSRILDCNPALKEYILKLKKARAKETAQVLPAPRGTATYETSRQGKPPEPTVCIGLRPALGVSGSPHLPRASEYPDQPKFKFL